MEVNVWNLLTLLFSSQFGQNTTFLWRLVRAYVDVHDITTNLEQKKTHAETGNKPHTDPLISSIHIMYQRLGLYNSQNFPKCHGFFSPKCPGFSECLEICNHSSSWYWRHVCSFAQLVLQATNLLAVSTSRSGQEVVLVLISNWMTPGKPTSWHEPLVLIIWPQ